MLYQIGNCSVTQNTNVVTGTGTSFVGNVAVGDSFKFVGENAIYSIISVDSNTQIKLSPVYAGTTKTNVGYQILTLGSRTPNLGLAEITAGLQDWPFWMTNEVIRKIDIAIAGKMDMGQSTYTSFLTAPKFVSNISTGTSPMDVTSTTKVTNLNTDMVDGFHASQTPGNSTILVSDSAGITKLNSGAFISSYASTPAANNTIVDFYSGARLISTGATATTYSPIILHQKSSNGSVYRDVLTIDAAGVTKFSGSIKLSNISDSSSTALDWYEEATWTPTGNNVTLTLDTCRWTRIGNVVTITAHITWPTTSNTDGAQIVGLPFAAVGSAGAAIGYSNNPTKYRLFADSNNTIYAYDDSGVYMTNSQLSGSTVRFTLVYHC